MKKYANSIIGAILSAGIIVFLASCLNPIGFDPSNIQLKIDAKVSGEVDVRSSDYAILWVINRTSSVDVTGMTISRAGAETKEVTGKPARASTHASYHEPTDIPYRVDITYALSPGNTNSAYDAGNSTGSFTIAEKYMPKAGANYVIYVYRADDGKVIVVEDERITRPLDPSDTENPIEPPAEGTPTYPLIIRNVTADLDVEYITFRLDDKILTIDPGPKAKDEVLWYFEAGQYKVQVPLSPGKITVEKNVPIIKPNDSQSWHTLYMWIYKTTNNFYSTTTTWPPNPNDAADVSMSDIAGPGMGILQVINKSESSDVIQKIRIGPRVYLFGTIDSPSFTKDMEWMRVLDPGIHTVEIMPSRQNYYGMALTVDIKEGEVTTLSYYDRLADPDLPPPEIGGYGSGLVKIINNSTGVVNSVVIRDTSANNSMSYSYGEFTPPDPINYNKTGRIGVVGDADFPITEGAHYLIQVELNLPDDYVVIERLAALKDQVVEIVINESEIQNVHGANITLVNSTSAKPVQITTVTLYNVSNPGEASSFSGLNWNPQGNVPSGGTAGFRVNSSISMPIKTGSSFSASIGITGNNQTAIVVKSVGSLYDTNQTITITDADVDDMPSSSTARTLRFIRAGGKDTLASIVFVHRNTWQGSLVTDSDTSAYTGNDHSTAYGSSRTPLWQTGQTGIPWATEANQIGSKSKFEKRFPAGPGITYHTAKLGYSSGGSSTKLDSGVGTSTEKYIDITVPFTGTHKGDQYFIFFMEGDKNRGATDGTFNPTAINKNFFFFVDLEQLPDVTRNGAKVVPIFYDSYWNTPSIGIRFDTDAPDSPASNRKYPPLRNKNHNSYSFDE